jgi:hypothetical protein
MELSFQQLEVLKELALKGYICNWYKAFGIDKLAVYKSSEAANRIIITPKGSYFEAVEDFKGYSFFSPEREEILKDYSQAIIIFSKVTNSKYLI